MIIKQDLSQRSKRELTELVKHSDVDLKYK